MDDYRVLTWYQCVYDLRARLDQLDSIHTEYFITPEELEAIRYCFPHEAYVCRELSSMTKGVQVYPGYWGAYLIDVIPHPNM